MSIADDLAKIAVQESELAFPSFDAERAWKLGSKLRQLAVERNHKVAIDVRRFGQQLFFTALANTTPDNSEWVRRKSNVVARFLRSSYAVGLQLQQKNSDMMQKYGLPLSDYASHGGSFPLHVRGAGVIGAVTVSGLAQREDHGLVVEALCIVLGKEHVAFRLPPE
jgi:uncharacterized protein (UPF0303 family)